MPRDDSPPIAQPDGEDRSVLFRAAPEPDAQWSYGDEDDQAADIYLPPPHAAAVMPSAPVVLVHGGFWRPEYDRVHVRPLARALAATGRVVLSIDYRRIPGDPDATTDDVRLALARLAEAPPPGWPERPAIVIGHSAGGHLALLVAADDRLPVTHVVALAPVADLRMAQEAGLDGDAVIAFLGTSADLRPDLDPSQRPPVVPVTVIHGTRDSLVPVLLSHAYSGTGGRPARVIALADTGHFELIDPEADAFAQLLSVLAAAGIE